jgi:hypothetical protein
MGDLRLVTILHLSLFARVGHLSLFDFVPASFVARGAFRCWAGTVRAPGESTAFARAAGARAEAVGSVFDRMGADAGPSAPDAGAAKDLGVAVVRARAFD